MKQKNINEKSTSLGRTKVYFENRYEKPKHYFKLQASQIQSYLKNKVKCSLLDVGSATGEYSHYLKKQFPDLDITNLEHDKKLVELGRAKVDNCKFVWGNAENMDMFETNSFDIVTMNGVLTIFDDFTLSINECIRVVKDKGIVLILSHFNHFPIDALVKWRYSGDVTDWNRGYNLISIKSLENFFSQHPQIKSWEFKKFILPFDLPKHTDDTIRAWTENNYNKERVFRNGLQMELNMQFLKLNTKKNQ